MTTRRTLSWPLPGTPEQVLRRLRDPDVARRRVEADPALQAQITELVSDALDGSVLVMEVVAQMPTSWVPDRFAGALPALPRIVRRESWRLLGPGAYADVDVQLDGVPATTMTAAARLDPDGDERSVLTYELQLEVALPLAGGLIERAVIDQICRAYEREAAVIRDA